jgi:hypothetical protein
MNPQIHWETLIHPSPGFGTNPRPWDDQPSEGSMDPDDLNLLIEALVPFTSHSEQCYFALWDGRGGLPITDEWPLRMETAPRRYLLFQGTLSRLRRRAGENVGRLVPDLWWPTERSWYVGCDTDLYSTYVGGSLSCIQALLKLPHLETLEAQPNHMIGSDQID